MTENSNDSRQRPSFPSVFFEEQLIAIVQRARANKAIPVWDLFQLMAADENYKTVLPQLWKIFELNKANNLPSREINVDTVEGRAYALQYLLARWAAISEYEEICFKDLPKYPRLPLYYYEGGSLRELQDDKKRKEEHFIKLDDLADYLKQLKENHDLSVPLPMQPFSDQDNNASKQQSYDDAVFVQWTISFDAKRGEFLTGKESANKLKLQPFEFFQYVKRNMLYKWLFKFEERLMPYSPAYLQPIKIGDPLGIRKAPITKEEEFDPSYSRELEYMEDLLPHVEQCLFKREDVEQLEIELRKEDGLDQQEETAKVDIPEESPKDLATIQFIEEADHEIGIIWKAIIKDVRLDGVSLSDSEPSDLQDTAQRTLIKPEYSFEKVNKEHFKTLFLFDDTVGSTQPKRYFRETLLQRLIQEQTREGHITKREIRKLLIKINKKSKKNTAAVTDPLKN